MNDMRIKLIGAPTEADWLEVKRRAIITEGFTKVKTPPTSEWKTNILRARHSPIRFLRYSFLIENIPGNTATHLARHVHAQPYVSSLRNDRQNRMDGDKAPRDTPVHMIYDVNAEELMVIANKRLCMKAAVNTHCVVGIMCNAAIMATPELKPFLVPMCEYLGGHCPEMHPCGRCPR